MPIQMDPSEPDYDQDAYEGYCDMIYDQMKDEIALGERDSKKPYNRIGWEVRTSTTPKFKAYSVLYFPNAYEAYEYAKTLRKKKVYYRVIKRKPVHRCKCGRYYPSEDTECARCEKIRFDAEQDYPRE